MWTVRRLDIVTFIMKSCFFKAVSEVPQSDFGVRIFEILNRCKFWLCLGSMILVKIFIPRNVHKGIFVHMNNAQGGVTWVNELTSTRVERKRERARM